MKKLKLRSVDNGARDCAEQFYAQPVVKFLQQHFDVEYSADPDYVIFGPFGLRHADFPRAIKIFSTIEAASADLNVADYAIDFDYLSAADRHLRYPYAFYNERSFELAASKHLSPDLSREKFCAYMVSMPSKDSPRDEFFAQLNARKAVASGGRHLNNQGGAYIADKLAWLRQFRFNICFENAASVGYLTEKLIDAHAAGCVPIYWGDPSILRPELAGDFERDAINPRAMINVSEFKDFSEAIEYILAVDADENLRAQILAQPAFTDDKNWAQIYKKRYEEFLLYIFNQPLELARRAPQHHFTRRHLRDKYGPINTTFLKHFSRKLRGKI